MSETRLVQFLVQRIVPFALVATISGFLLAFGVSSLGPAQAQEASGPVFSDIAEPGEVYIDFTMLRPEPPPRAVEVPEGSPYEGVGFVATPTGELDPLLQEGLEGFETFDVLDSHGQLSSSIQNFQGLASFAPPDTNGDVGLNHYIQMVNATQFQIWDKQGTSLAGPITFNTLWTAAAAGDPTFQPNCQDTTAGGGFNKGDPIVVYDPLADRWLLAQFADPNHMCIAISQTSDPTAATWYLYQFNTLNFPDYEKFGVWPDGYYMTAHESGTEGIYVFDRSDMLTGNPATFVKFSVGEGGACPRSSRLLPSDLDGPPPPAGSPNFILRAQEACQSGAGDRIQIWEFHADWQAGGTPTFNLTDTIDGTSTPALANFALMPCNIGGGGVRACIRQPDGGANPVDALTGRPMMQLKYRKFSTHESIVTNMTVDAGGNNNAGIRWWELRRTPPGSGNWSIHQQGTYAPQQPGSTDTTWVSRWMGSIAMDKDGNIALGYSITNGDQANPIFPGISYTGRVVSDPLGLLPQGEETVIAGAAAQAGSRRWGDYSAMSVDPVDDCTFWYTQEFINAGGNVRTQIASFNFPSTCGTDLEISKTTNTQLIHAGEELFYDITVTNNGPNDATGVTVVDTLPAEVTYISDTDSCAVTGVQELTCDLGDIANGDSSTFTIKVKVDSDAVVNDPDGAITITNTASVTAEEPVGDTDETNNEASVTTFVEEWADLQVTKVCKPDTQAHAGEPGICTIVVENLGTSDARNVVLVDMHLSSRPFTIVSATPPCVIGGSVVTCMLGNLAAGASETIEVVINVDDAADVNDIATVTSGTPDPNPSNNKAQGSLSFVASADLGLTKTVTSGSGIAGTNVIYTLDVTNGGPSTAVNVVVEDVAPLGVSIVSVSAPGGSCNAGVPGNAALPTTCNFDSLANGGSASMTVEVHIDPDVPAGTILHNDAQVSSDVWDLNNANDLASANVTVTTSADLAITKSDNPDPVVAGDTLTYQLFVINNGPSTAVDPEVTDTLPTEVSFLSATVSNGMGTCVHQSGIVSCDVNDLDPGQSVDIFIQVLVDPSVPDGNSISNSASVVAVGTPNDPVAGNNTATENTGVIAKADLWMEKTGNILTGNASGTVEYQLTVHNDPGCTLDEPQNCGTGGPSDAQNVTISDSFPVDSKKLRFEFASPGCTYTGGASHSATCTLGTIPVGTSVTVVFQFDAKGNLGLQTNTATLSSTTTDPVAGNNSDSFTMDIKGGKGNTGGKP